jgi:hypothetical protein
MGISKSEMLKEGLMKAKQEEEFNIRNKEAEAEKLRNRAYINDYISEHSMYTDDEGRKVEIWKYLESRINYEMNHSAVNSTNMSYIASMTSFFALCLLLSKALNSSWTSTLVSGVFSVSDLVSQGSQMMGQMFDPENKKAIAEIEVNELPSISGFVTIEADGTANYTAPIRAADLGPLKNNQLQQLLEALVAECLADQGYSSNPSPDGKRTYFKIADGSPLNQAIFDTLVCDPNNPKSAAAQMKNSEVELKFEVQEDMDISKRFNP